MVEPSPRPLPRFRGDADYADARTARRVDRRDDLLIPDAALADDVDDLLRSAGVHQPQMVAEPGRSNGRAVDAIAWPRQHLEHEQTSSIGGTFMSAFIGGSRDIAPPYAGLAGNVGCESWHSMTKRLLRHEERITIP